MDEELMFRMLFIFTYAIFAGVRIYYRSQNLGRKSEREYSQWTKAMAALGDWRVVATIGALLVIGTVLCGAQKARALLRR